MISDVQKLLDEYWIWIKDQTVLRQIGDWIEITTPYLDRHNDHIQIYAKRRNGGFVLTDDGYVLQDLEQSGCKIDTEKRKMLLTMALNGFGVKREGHALEVRATPANFALRKHSLIQAVLAVHDLFYLASPVVASLFYEDVVAWLDLSEVRYTPDVKFTGKSGFDYVFDFVIPKSKVQPERIVKAIGKPNRETAQQMILAWHDTKEVRPPESRAYAILNDSEAPVSESIIDAMRSYEVRPVPWSERERVREELAA